MNEQSKPIIPSAYNGPKPEGIIPFKINKKTGMTNNADENGLYEYFYEEYPPFDNSYFVIN